MEATSSVQLRANFLNGLIPSATSMAGGNEQRDEQHREQHRHSASLAATIDAANNFHQQHFNHLAASTPSRPVAAAAAPVVGRKAQRMTSTNTSMKTFEVETRVDANEDEDDDHVPSSQDDSIESMQRRLDRLQLSLNSSAISFQPQQQQQQQHDEGQQELSTSYLEDANVGHHHQPQQHHQHNQQHYHNGDDHDDTKGGGEVAHHGEHRQPAQLQADVHPFNHHDHHHHDHHHHHHLHHHHQHHQHAQNEQHYYKSALDDDMKPSESIVHYAATENQLVMMARLLEESSANLELTDTECNTPLIRAAIAGNEEMVKFLVEQNANVNAQNLFDNTTLHEAAWRGYSRIIRLLCHNDKTKLNLKNKQGHTALHLAAQKGHNQSCRIILLSGCKPNKKNNFGDTALHSAARYGHIGVVRILISAFANVNELNKNDDTALHIAAAMGRKKLTKVLLESGCNPTIINKQGETPMNIALRKAYLEIQELIANPPPFTPIYLKQREIYVKPFQSSYKDIYSALPKTPELVDDEGGCDANDDEHGHHQHHRHNGQSAGRRHYPLRCKSDFSNCYLNFQTNQSVSDKQGTSVSKYYSSILSRQASPLDSKQHQHHNSRQQQQQAHHSGQHHHNHHHQHRHRHKHPLYSEFPKPKLETLPTEPLEKGEQYFVDLSGHIHKSKIKEEKSKKNSFTLTLKKRL